MTGETSESGTSCEKSGLVYAYVLSEDAKPRRVGWEGVRAFRPGAGLLWVHVDYVCDDVLRWLVERSGIEAVVREGLLADQPRPRAVVEDDGLMMIMRGVNLNQGAAAEDMVSLRVWVDADHIVTMRHRRVGAMRALAEQIEAGRAPTTAGDFLVEIIELMLERIARVVDKLEDHVAHIEDEMVRAESTELRQQLAEARRKAIALRRYIGPEREVVARVQALTVQWLTDADRLRLRECTDRLMRIVDGLDSARDRAAVTQEELNNRLSEMTNRRLYVVSIIAAVFVPLGFITGLLGVNLGGIPGTKEPLAFGFLCGALVLLVLIQLWLFKRFRWL